jgi:hypothetical protein
MKARRNRDAVERALESEPLSQLSEYRHLTLGPRDPGLAFIGEARIGYVVWRAGRLSHSPRSPLEANGSVSASACF